MNIKNMLSDQFIESVIASIVSAIAIWVYSKLYTRITKIKFISRANKVGTYFPHTYLISYVLTLLSIFLIYWFEFVTGLPILISLIISTLIFIWLLMGLLSEYKKVGISGVDTSIKKGMDYKEALKGVQSEFKFLGVGANKLTINGEEFESAIRRAGIEGKPVRLLLCHPDSDALITIAKKANKTGDDIYDFSRNVKRSLERLSELKNKGLRIDVRFYKASAEEDMPIFRLMFYNSKYCLASYTVFGVPSHTGEQLPQLHLVSSDQDHGEDSFYFAYEKMFERLWNNENTSEWDYKSLLPQDKVNG